MRIAIIGAKGFVGKQMARMLKKHYEVVEYDLDLGSKREVNKCDLGIICVPTPMSKTDVKRVDKTEIHRCDTSIVESVVKWLSTPLIMIKSTVEVGTTDRLAEKYGKSIVFSPEFSGETRYDVSSRMDFHKKAEKTPMFIVGGDSQDCNEILDIFLPVMGPEKHYLKMDARTAEFVKYMENDFYARKVIWANEKRDQADALNVDWWQAWEAWGLDPRNEKMHTAVFKSNRGYGGKCFPKDVEGLMYSSIEAGYTPEQALGSIKENKKYRGEN